MAQLTALGRGLQGESLDPELIDLPQSIFHLLRQRSALLPGKETHYDTSLSSCGAG